MLPGPPRPPAPRPAAPRPGPRWGVVCAVWRGAGVGGVVVGGLTVFASVATGAADSGAGSTGRAACAWSFRSNWRGVAEAFASSGVCSKPNIATENLQGVDGRPPISKAPSPSVTVVIL